MHRFAVLALMVVVGGESDALTPYKSDEGRFTVLLPGTPETISHKMAGGVLKIWVAKGSAGVYSVATLDVPEAAGENEEKLQARLAAGRDQGVASARGKLTKETPIKLEKKYPGLEIVVELPATKDFMRSRIYIVETRLYQVTVVGSSDYVNSAAGTKFLDSLTVGK